jgi:hypothetical protein
MSLWRKRKSSTNQRKTMKLAYCDYIAHIIKKNLLSNDYEKLLDEVGGIQYDIGANGEFDSTTKTIDVLDMQGKSYRITIQEL